jgi:hypothetical protein
MILKPMTIRKGDLVWWRGSFGTEGWKQTKVLTIDKCSEGNKYGDPVESIPLVEKDTCVFDLACGHWAYGYQILPVPSELGL